MEHLIDSRTFHNIFITKASYEIRKYDHNLQAIVDILGCILINIRQKLCMLPFLKYNFL